MNTLHELLQCLPQQHTESIGRDYTVTLKLCKDKLAVVTAARCHVPHIVNDYHFQQFCEHVRQLKDLIEAKDEAKRKRLFESRYLFIEVQRLLIAMHYHLDLFAHFLLKESSSEHVKSWQAIEISFVGFEDSAKQFWRKVLGHDVSGTGHVDKC